MNVNSGPGYGNYPDHRIAMKPACMRVQATFNGEVISDSRETIRLDETGYAPVDYFPRGDVKKRRLSRSSHQTYCPFKGRATYFSVLNGPAYAAWCYEQPYDEVGAIEHRLAFYPDRVSLISVSPD